MKSGLWKIVKNLVDVEYASEAPKRRSPNIGGRRAKLKKKKPFFHLDKIWLDAIVKNNSCSNWRSSKYVVFPRRQPYFTYGDLHSSGLENHAFQLTILQCKKKSVTPTVSKCAYFQGNLNTFRVSS